MVNGLNRVVVNDGLGFHYQYLDRIDRPPSDADTAPCDPFETEIRMLRRAIGTLLPLAMRYFGIIMPESRKALNSLVEGILGGKLPRSSR